MAMYFQYRHICKRVDRQLSGPRDEEEGPITSSEDDFASAITTGLRDEHTSARFPRNDIVPNGSPTGLRDEENDANLSGGEGPLSGSTTLCSGPTSPSGPAPHQHDAEKSTSEIESVEPWTMLPGISHIFEKRSEDGPDIEVLLVGWDGPKDPHNPRNWPNSKRLAYTFIVSSIGLMVLAASFIDSTTAEQAADALHVSEEAESLATGLFLVGFGFGVVTSVPLCALFGRGLVYIVELALFMIWTMGAALSPNFAAQITFRLLAGFCGSAPLTAAGVSIFEMWNPREQTWAFPVFGIWAFGGPSLGKVMGAWLGPCPQLGWRWSDWIILIGTGVVFFIVGFFLPETMPARLLKYKAIQIRKRTKDDRFKTQQELEADGLGQVLWKSLFQHFRLITEPIIYWEGLYMFWVYMVQLSFLCGYKDIFSATYGLDQGLTNSIFVGIFVGVLLGCIPVFAILMYMNKDLARRGDNEEDSAMRPEIRLLYVMWGGAPSIPISLFWIGWTAKAGITPWSGIIATVLFGYGAMSVYISAYLYIADSYKQRAATALAILTFLRYLAASVFTTAEFPFYEWLGVPWALTLLGVWSLAFGLVPYALYHRGPKLRKESRFAYS